MHPLDEFADDPMPTQAPRLQAAPAPTPSYTEDVTRALPHAIGPEKSILSSMLQEPQQWIGAAVEIGLTASHFYMPSHATLFATLVDLENQGTEIELVSLVQKLLDTGLLDRIGGPAALTDIYTYAPSAGHFRHHAKIVQDKFVLRSIIQNATESIAAAYDAPDEVDELLDSTEERFMAIRNTRETGTDVAVKTTVEVVCDMVQAKMRGEQEVFGISTGYDTLDRLGVTLKPGEVFIIAARPSIGKTSLMMNIAERVCLDFQNPTLVFSLEMTRTQLIDRLIFSRARINSAEVVSGWNPNKGDLQRFHRAAMDVATSLLHINDQPDLTIGQLRAIARRKHKEAKLKLIAIDYLQLLHSTSKQATGSREREVAEISSGIKALAKELGIPIILLAQLNRGPEQRTGKNYGKPRLADLRESGSIEQDADMVSLLYRASYYADDEASATDDASAELIIAKNRNGPTGSAHLTFCKELMRFESGSPAAEQNMPKQRSFLSRDDD